MERTDRYPFEIALVYKEDEDYKIEKVYAVKVGDYYQLKAIPAFASNVAYDDLISVVEEDGTLFFEDMVKPSGHSVLHLYIFKAEHSSVIFSKLASYGLGINYLHNNLYLAIDVPVNVPYGEIRSYLISEREKGTFDFEESCLSDEHRSLVS